MQPGTTHLVVGCVDQNLVDYLEEAGNILDVPLDHAFRDRVIRPNMLRYKLHAANVRVWPLENVFQLGELCGEQLDPMSNAATEQTLVYVSDALFLFLFAAVAGRGADDGPDSSSSPPSCGKLISAFSSTSASTFLGAALGFAGAFALGLGWALGGGALA